MKFTAHFTKSHLKALRAQWLSILVILITSLLPAQASEKLVFLTNWFAQGEHGGFYQAKANGIYETAGLDVEIKMGGPQVNNLQLLLAGDADIVLSYDLQVLKSAARGVPLYIIGTSFQTDLIGLLTRPNIQDFNDLKGKNILLDTSSRASWWPWLRDAYGLNDRQVRPYTFNLQPFLVNENTVIQGYLSSEPFQLEKREIDFTFHLLSDSDYPPYGNILVTTQKYAAENPEIIAKFLRASAEGWISFMTGDPNPAIALIQDDNPKMERAQIEYAIRRLTEINALTGDETLDAARIGRVELARYEATQQLMLDGKLLSKPLDLNRYVGFKYWSE